jgi:hypothetical protein
MCRFIRLCRCFGDQHGLGGGFHRGDQRIEIAKPPVSAASFSTSPSTVAMS